MPTCVQVVPSARRCRASVAVASAEIELVRSVYDRDGRGVEHLYALYRPDRYSFEFDLVRAGGASKRSWFAAPLAARKAAAKSKSSSNIRFI